MGSYISSFGIERQVGRGEGIDELYNASAKPALGANNVVEVVVDEKGPNPNKGTGYGRDGAYLPAGALVVKATLLTESKGSAAGVTIDLVKKDGSDAKALLAATTPEDNGAAEAAGAAVGKRIAEDRYFKVGGTTTGLKAVLVVEYK